MNLCKQKFLKENPNYDAVQDLKDTYAYDPESGILSVKHDNYRKYRVGKAVGYLEKNGYFQLCHKYKTYRVHRVCWLIHFGTWPDGFIDHINGNRSDNRLENLREASPRVNSTNFLSVRTKKKLLGASFIKKANKWRAVITINKKHCHLGRFATELEAHLCYMEKLKEIDPNLYAAILQEAK